MGEDKQLPTALWRNSMYTVCGLATVLAVVSTLGSLRLIDWFWPLMVGGFGAGFCFLAWLVLSVVGLIRFRAVWPYVIAPVIVFGAIGAAILTGAPARVQFAASETALRDAAADCVPAHDIRVGYYRIDEVKPVDGGCLLYLPGGFLNRAGFAVLPDGPIGESLPRITTTYLSGDLYTFVWKF